MSAVLVRSVFSGLLFGGLAASTALAAPQIEFEISGTFAGPGGDPARLEYDSLITRYASSITNGSLGIEPEGSFNIPRVEIFSDPDITPTPSLYSEIQTFSYFGLINTYDVNDNRTSTRFVIAAQPGTIEGSAFEDVFADFLDDHPSITSLADFVTMIKQGPDFPNPGEGTTWIAFNSYVSDNTGDFAAMIETTFQSGQTLDLIAFDSGTSVGADIGDIQILANNIPEPATLGLAILPALALLRRRR